MEVEFNEANRRVFVRYIVEEHCRRSIKNGTSPLNKTQILTFLFPGFKAMVDEIIEFKKKEMSGAGKEEEKGEGGEYGDYMAMARMFKALDLSKKGKPADTEEEKGEEGAKASGKKVEGDKMDPEKMVNDAVNNKPWREQLSTEGTNLNTLLKSAKGAFVKQTVAILECFKLMGVDMKDDLMNTPMVEGDEEILLAILFQNLCQPDNSQRRDAIKNNNYTVITDSASATGYLEAMLRSNLQVEIASRESALKSSAVAVL